MSLYLYINVSFLFSQDIQTIEANWRMGRHNLQRINCRSENSKGVYCLQYDDQVSFPSIGTTVKFAFSLMKFLSDIFVNIFSSYSNLIVMYRTSEIVFLFQKIVSGLRDNTIKIWDRTSLQCYKVRGVRPNILESRIVAYIGSVLRVYSLKHYQ